MTHPVKFSVTDNGQFGSYAEAAAEVARGVVRGYMAQGLPLAEAVARYAQAEVQP